MNTNYKTTDWLQKTYSLIQKNQIDDALDLVFEKIDDMYLQNNFEECNNILKEVNIKKLDSNLKVGFLVITLAAKENLDYREQFYNDIERSITEDKKYILDGLK